MSMGKTVLRNWWLQCGLSFIERISEKMAFISDWFFEETISIWDVDTGATTAKRKLARSLRGEFGPGH